MAEINNDVVYIQLDRPRQLRFGHSALKRLTALTGKSMEQIDNGFDLEDLEKVLYAGLLYDARQNGETLLLEQMEELLDQAPSYQHILDKMNEAFTAAFGKQPEGKQAGNGPEK